MYIFLFMIPHRTPPCTDCNYTTYKGSPIVKNTAAAALTFNCYCSIFSSYSYRVVHCSLCCDAKIFFSIWELVSAKTTFFPCGVIQLLVFHRLEWHIKISWNIFTYPHSGFCGTLSLYFRQEFYRNGVSLEGAARKGASMPSVPHRIWNHKTILTRKP